MPAPDPDAIEISEDGRTVFISYRCGPSGFCPVGSNLGSNEKRNRQARVRRILQNIRTNNWTCRRCGEEIGLHKRADAQFCSYSCKKMAQRERRQEREASGGSP